MARPKSDNSVATVVGLLLVGESINIHGKPLPSVAVMVSNLKKKAEHKDKRFKLKEHEGIIAVHRVH